MNYNYILHYNRPIDFQNYKINNDNNNYQERKNDNYLKENSKSFWDNYYTTKDVFKKEDIKVYDDLIPSSISLKIEDFVNKFEWLYGYKNNKITTLLNYNEDEEPQDEDEDSQDEERQDEYILKNNELKCFYGNVLKNNFFEALFYEIILPNIDIENKENIKIDRAHIIGRLHNLSEFFHKDERSSVKYGPSVYVYLNKDWKIYNDGSLSFILDVNNVNIHHIQNKFFRTIVFPPNMYHKTSELSSYSLFENEMSQILEYHLIYN